MKQFRAHAPLAVVILLGACYRLPQARPCEPRESAQCRSNARVHLGRLLFYDPVLSRNNQVSCATCHQQARSFTDGVALTQAGVSGRPLKRHSPVLLNLQGATQGLFWDGGAKNLRSLVPAPVTNKDEMGMNLAVLFEKLEKKGYRPLFQAAFEDGQISISNFALAVESFVLTISSNGSKYDKFTRGEASLSEVESNGYAVYKSRCASCHPEPAFTDHSFHNVGLDAVIEKDLEQDPDIMGVGRERITFERSDRGKFKTPTLRNALLTGPYMHDGRIARIEDVIEHFSTGVKQSADTDPALAVGSPMSEKEKRDLLGFLGTLTDLEPVHRKDLSNPF